MAVIQPQPDEVKRQLEKMCNHAVFTKAHSCAAFLAYAVNETLEGREKHITEFSIASDVFNVSLDKYNKGTSIVRQTKANLDDRITSYYAGEGWSDPIRIDIPERTYTPTFRYNPLHARYINPIGHDLFAALGDYFRPSGDNPSVKCAVSGNEGDWYYLDGNTRNAFPGNIIPLCRLLRDALERSRTAGAAVPLELDADRLINTTAPKHFAEWRPAYAYACAHLTFHLGQPPLGDESNDVLALRLCDALYYARHHQNGDIISALIQSLLNVLYDVDSLDIIPAYRITLEITPLLVDSGQQAHAEQWISLTQERLLVPFRSALMERDALSMFAHLRRLSEFAAETVSDSTVFDMLASEAFEHADNTNSRMAITTVVARRLLKHKTPETVTRAYEDLSSLIDSADHEIRSKRIDPANTSTIMTQLAFATCLLKPDNWKRSAEEILSEAMRLRTEGGHRLSHNLWRRELTEASRIDPKAGAMLARSISPHLAHGTEQLGERQLRSLTRRMRSIKICTQLPDGINISRKLLPQT